MFTSAAITITSMTVFYDWLDIVAPAWIAGSLLALLSAPLGCLVLWQRMAFFADALAHGTLFGVAIAGLLQMPFALGITLVSVVLVLSLLWLEDERLPNDAVLAVLSVCMLCMGLLTLTQLSQMQSKVIGYLFGNLLEVGWAQLPILSLCVIFGLGTVKLIWRPQIIMATHLDLAQVSDIQVTRQRLFFMGVLAGFCALALQAVGSLLISGLLILPALSARLFAHSPKQMVIISVIVAQLAVTGGIWGSVLLDIQTGLTIVLGLAVVFFSAFFISRMT